MIHPHRIGALALLTLGLGAGPALAQDSRLPTAGEIALAIAAGPEFDAGGSFHGGFAAGPVAVGSSDWGDVFDYALNVQADIAMGLDTRSQIGVTLGWTTADGGGVDVGTVGADVLSASFGDYEAYTATAYYRRYFEVGSGFFPYVAVNGGVRYVDAIDATFTSAGLPALGLPGSVGGRFYDDSWVPTLGFTFGWRNNFRSVALGLEVGLQYDFELKDEDAALAPLGLAGLNDSGDRWTIPVRLIIVY